MKHPFIIGAGGVASYLLPALIKAFRPESLVILDKDVLEPRNLDRQLFRPDMVGRNKADALIDTVMARKDVAEVTVRPEWFSDSTVVPERTDAIICVADNHLCRLHACELADRIGVRAYIGGNEYFDNEAYVYDPRYKGTIKDPRHRYPSITSDHTGSPIRCTGEVQETFPQLAVANFGCAAKLLHLLWTYERWVADAGSRMDGATFRSVFASLPYELASSVYETGQR
jgi:molybdopterin/thiamine biosynthesis adenylyltransferase